MMNNIIFLVVKSRLALVSPGCLFVRRHHAKMASSEMKKVLLDCVQVIKAKTLFPDQSRQAPRFSIRMVIGIFCSDTEAGAVTPPGVMQKK